MKSIFYITLISGCILLACNSKPSDQTDSSKITSPPEVAKNQTSASITNGAACFRYFGTKDTVYLQLSELYGTMTGMLVYKNYQKDKNLGTLQGKMVGDILLAEYTFSSEGVTSTRQVAFRKKGDDYIEGFGDVNDVNGKVIFKDLSALKFDESRVYVQVPCKK
ncbi:MAG: hypothetical protein ABJC12_10210 [Saprospiraceae bacterium]